VRHDLGAGLPGVHARAGLQHDAGQVAADHVVGQVVPLGDRRQAAVALEEAEGRDRLEDRGPDGVVVDRAGHDRDQRLTGRELRDRDLVDVQGLARVLLLGGQTLEHRLLVLAHHDAAVGLRQREVAELLRCGVAREDRVADLLQA
jgi:hypothetical protein